MGKRFRQLTQTATDADLAEGNYFGLDCSNVTKKLPGNVIAPRSGSTSEIRNLPDKNEGYLALNDGNGTGKFDIKKIFNAMVAGFTERSSKNPYAPNDEFEYQGKLYKVLEGFYGAFDASKVCELPLADALVSKVTGKNILHFRDAVRGYYMDYNGTLVADEKMLVTDYIPVQPSTQYYLSARNKASGNYTYPATTQSPRIFFYKSDLTSAGTNIYTQHTFTTTQTTAFIRIGLNYVDFVEIQLEKGSARTTYEPYTSIYPEFAGEFLHEKLAPKVEKLDGINVFDASQPFVQNKYLASNGAESYLANFRISPYIPVEPLTDYVVYGVKSGAIVKPGQNSTALYACFYDESKKFLSSTLASTYYYHTPENAKYMRVSFYPGEWTAYMACKGTYLVPYQPCNVIYGYINDLGIIDEHLKGSRLPPAIRKACICIMSDDGVVSADSKFADILKRHKLTCGFAVDPNAGSFKQDFNTYRMLCRQGFSVHNHYGQPLNTYANETNARKALALYQNILTDNGLPVNSFVCPGNLYIDDYRSMLGGLFAYVFGTGGVAHNTPSSDVLKLGRYSIETRTLEEVTTYIDAAVANGEMICLFNHSYNIGGAGYNDEAFYDSLCNYIKGLSNDGLVYFGNPDECVKFYYELR